MAVDKKNSEELAAEQARKEAELFVKGKSKEDIEKELKRMEKGPGFLGWVRDRINGFLNFVKIAALSVLLGRRETSRRMDAGTLEAEQKAREDATCFFTFLLFYPFTFKSHFKRISSLPRLSRLAACWPAGSCRGGTTCSSAIFRLRPL